MSGADDDRRRRDADSEAFKYNIVASQSEIKTKVELLHDMVTLQLADHRKRLETLEEVIIGSAARPGLLEKNRNITKDIAKLFGIISAVGFLIFKVLSPLYDAWMNRWIPQKIAATEDAQPHAPAKIVRKTLPLKPVDLPAKKQ